LIQGARIFTPWTFVGFYISMFKDDGGAKVKGALYCDILVVIPRIYSHMC
jgi:hypothetical protein